MSLKFDLSNRPTDLDQVQQMIALELAIGSSLPDNFDAWPVMLAHEWNMAVDAGRIPSGPTLGHMARGFLNYRSEKLS